MMRQHLAVDLTLQPRALGIRNGTPDLPRAPAREDVVWWIASASDAPVPLGRGEYFTAYAALARRGEDAIPDAVFDVATNGERTCDTPTLEGSAIRGWVAVEVFEESQSDASAVTYRVLLDGAPLYHDGATWRTPAAGEWNTKSDLEARFADLPRGTSLAIRAWLSTTDAAETPGFAGARVVYEVRWTGAWDDAVVRTVAQAVKDRAVVGAVVQFEGGATAGTAYDVNGDGEFDLDVAAVIGAYDLTADPEEASPLAGSLAGSVWTPDAPLDPAHEVLIEFAHRPQVMVRRSRDYTAIEQWPTVVLQPQGGVVGVQPVMESLTRRTALQVPTASRLPSPTFQAQPVNVRVLATTGGDANVIAQLLGQVTGEHGYVVLLSPASGLAVGLKRVSGFGEVHDQLTAGIYASQGSWQIEYASPVRAASESVTLVRDGGLTATARNVGG